MLCEHVCPFQSSCVLKLHLQDTSSHLKSVGNTNNRNKYLSMWILYVFDFFLLDTAVWPREQVSLVTKLPFPTDGAHPVGGHLLHTPGNNWLNLLPPRPKKKKIMQLYLSDRGLLPRKQAVQTDFEQSYL